MTQNIEPNTLKPNNTMKRILKSIMLLFLALPLWAQPDERELADPMTANVAAWNNVNDLTLKWGSIDTRYSRSEVPDISPLKVLSLYAWRGERVSAQAVLTAPVGVKKATIEVSDLMSGKKTISSAAIRKYFVRYTLSDKDSERKDSILVADRLSPVAQLAIDAQTVRPIWLDIRVPQDAAPGTYRGTLTVNCDGRKLSLPLTVEVGKRILPPPAEWAFHLDLWQNPYAVARYYNVPLWSKAHFDAMRPVMQHYAEAGGKVITCSIIQHPWNGQTEDPFESMITKAKTIDGRWLYDYTVFDRWVQFMMDCGVTKQIDCYTLVPWHYKFDYFDLATNSVKYVECKPGEKGYEDFILPFLRDFAAHLKQKGWFSRTCIAMDERPMDQMQAAYDIVKRADEGYRIAGAFNYFPEFTANVHDASVFYSFDLLEENVLAQRRAKGDPVTFYTCCGPAFPNTFTFSPPAESAYMGWHAAAAGYDGYLRWAWNSWVKAPCQDSRFRTWPSGDCFLVYPGESCIRLERLVEGIQAYEKIRILMADLPDKKKARLKQAVERFRTNKFTAEDDAAAMIRAAQAVMRSVEK